MQHEEAHSGKFPRLALPAVAALSLLVNGCIPVDTSYYQVSAAEGKVGGGSCLNPAQYGPRSTLVLKRGPVQFTIDGSNIGQRSVDLPYDITINISIKFGDDVHMDWDDFKATDSATQKSSGTRVGVQSIETTADYMYTGFWNGLAHVQDEIDIDYGSEINPYTIPGAAKDADTTHGAFFDMDILLSTPIPPDMDFTLPAMTVDGDDYPPLVLHFDRKKGFYCSEPPP